MAPVVVTTTELGAPAMNVALFLPVNAGAGAGFSRTVVAAYAAQ